MTSGEGFEDSLVAQWRETLQLGGPPEGGPLEGDASRTYQPRARPTDEYRAISAGNLARLTLSGVGGWGALPDSSIADPLVDVRAPTLTPDSRTLSPQGERAEDASATVTTDSALAQPPADPAPADLAAPERAPLFQVLEVIGRGGMGEVYRARQSSLERDVALKRLHPQQATRSGQQRFLAEAIVTGKLDHPNIVPVYELGHAPNGEPVLAMKLVEGTAWADLLSPRTPELQDQARDYELADHLRVLIQVTNAVAFAHSRGIVHNDLKPANVMLGEFGEVLLMDWGLALDISPKLNPASPIPHRSTLTNPCGTPAYMPPELAAGDGDEVGTWTDTYLLGGILCELLRGSPPHQAKTIKGVLLRAWKSEPPELPQDVPEELRAICHKACARAPEDRYRRAVDLRDDLEAYLTHRESLRVGEDAAAKLSAASASAQGAAEPEALAGRRDQLYADFGEAIAGFGQALVLWEGNAQARAGRERARLAYARCALRCGDLGLAEAQLSHLGEEAAPLRARITAARAQLAQAARVARLQRYGLAAAVVVIVAGLALGLGLVRAEEQRTARQAELARQAQASAEEERAQADEARRVAELRTADALAAHAHALGSSGRWSEARGLFREARGLYGELGLPSTAAELGLLAAAGASPEPIHRLPAHEGEARAVAFLPDGDRLVSVGADGRAQLWDVRRGQRLRTLGEDFGALSALSVSPLASWVAVGGEGGAWVLPLDAPGPERSLPHPAPVEALASDPAGLELISGARDGSLLRWNAASGAPLTSYVAHTRPLSSVHAPPNEAYLFSASRGRLVWWNRGGTINTDYDQSRTWRRPPDLPLKHLQHAPAGAGGSTFAFAAGHQVEVWSFTRYYDTSSGRKTLRINDYAAHYRLDAHRAPVTGLCFTPDGGRLLTCSEDGRILLWEVPTAVETDPKTLPRRVEPLRTLSAPEGLLGLALEGEGRWVAGAGRGGQVFLWDLGLAERQRSGAERPRIPLTFTLPPEEPPLDPRTPKPPPPPPLTTLASSPSGELALSGDAGGGLALWDTGLGRRLERLAWHEGAVLAASFLDERRFLSVGAEGWLRVWDLEGPQPLATRTLIPRAGEAMALEQAVISPAGRYALVSQPDGAWALVDPQREADVGAALARGAAGPAITAMALDDEGQRALARADRSLRVTALGGAPRRFDGALRPLRALCFAGARIVGADAEGRLTVWSQAGRVLARKEQAHGGAVRVLRPLEQGRLVASGGDDGTWRVWLLPQRAGAELAELGTFVTELGPLRGLALDGAGGRLLAAGERQLALWPLDHAAQAARLQAGRAGAAGLSRWLAFRGALRPALLLQPAQLGGHDALLRARAAWELDLRHTAQAALAQAAQSPADEALPPAHLALLRRALARELELEGSVLGAVRERVRGLALTPRGRLLSASQWGQVQERDLATGALLRTLVRHEEDITSFALSPDGSLLGIGDRRGRVGVFQADGRRRYLGLAQRAGGVQTLRFAPDAQSLLVAHWDKTIRRWPLEGDAPPVVLARADKRYVKRLSCSPSGRWLAGSDTRGGVYVWDLEGETPARFWTADEQGNAAGLTFLAEEELFAWCSRAKRFKVFDLEGALVREGELGGEGYLRSITVDAASKRALVTTSARWTGRGAIWDLERGRVLGAWLQPDAVMVTRFLPGGERAIVGTGAGRLLLRSLSSE